MSIENPWKRTGSKVVYHNPWISVREDEVIRPDGSPGIYSVVEIKPSVGILAVNSSREIALVRQWRYTLGKPSIEIPTGGSAASDNDMKDAAARELREETGLIAENWQYLGEIDNSNGVTTDVAHIFLATHLSQGTDDQEAEESIELTWTDLDCAIKWAIEGKITESVSVAGLLKLHVQELNGNISI